MAESEAFLLPKHVRPISYKITLQPDFQNFSFAGSEAIEIDVLEPTSAITLNSESLTVSSATLKSAQSVVIKSDKITDNQLLAQVTILFENPVDVGRYTLEVDFSGTIGDTLIGFYRAEYKDDSGHQRYLATTQFEPAHARRAFPCWDEPSLKASFELTLLIPSDMDAVSNTPLATEAIVETNLKRMEFHPTPRMSTYLLAFVIGDLAHIDGRAADGTIIRVWATRGKEDQGQYALETSIDLLAYFNEYFGVPYPLPKLDHIAIPDFAAGAMENWGAITYREAALLVDPMNSSSATKQRVAEIISHEMAHMWFGDLVTMEWWNDLWLNESFASWMGDKAVDHLHPEWEMWTQFIAGDTFRAFDLDGLKSSHPIEADVKQPAEVEQLFDAISYSKGASLIRMLENYLGPEVFRSGLHNYISSHQYSNARTEDLWAAMGNVSGKPVRALMDSWTTQMGYPVLQVNKRAGEAVFYLEMHQHRFLYSNLLHPGDSDDGQLWEIPVNVVSSWSSEPTKILIQGSQATLEMNLPITTLEEGAWFKLNTEQTGFYRVNLHPDDWTALINPIQKGLLSAADRLGIQNDAYALSQAGYTSVTGFLELAKAYVNEPSPSVWRDLAANLGQLDLLLFREPFYQSFRNFAHWLFKPMATSIGWKPGLEEGHLQTLLRSTLLSQAGYYGDPVILEEARDRFNQFIETPDGLSPDLRGLVYGLNALTGDHSTYQHLWDLEKSTDLQEEKMRVLGALTRFTQPELLRDLLNRSLSSEIRSQDTVAIVVGVASNRFGADLAWEFVKQNWSEFNRRYGSGGFALMRLVSIPSHFSTQESLQDVRSFFKAHPAPAADRTVEQSLEQIELNVRWLERNISDLAQWAEQYK